jgi:hypothetical protein
LTTYAIDIHCQLRWRRDVRGSAQADRKGEEDGGKKYTKEGGGPHKGASRPIKKSKGSNPNERTNKGTGESRDKGLNTDGNTRTSEEEGERSWRLAIRGRLRANGYACGKRSPFQNLSRNLFPPRRFSPPDDSAAFNGTARQPSHIGY